MSKVWQRNILRALLVLSFQLILLKRIDITFGEFNYIHFTIYPIIFVLFPFKMNKTLLVFVGFCIGLFVDLFYDSLGIHAFACTFIAYMRTYILNLLSPREGYGKDGLTSFNYGLPWFFTYLSTILFLHLLVLYSIEAFSFVYLKEIILRTIFSFIASLFLLMVTNVIFNPKY